MDVENKLDIRIYSSNLNYIESKAKKVLDLCGDKIIHVIYKPSKKIRTYI